MNKIEDVDSRFDVDTLIVEADSEAQADELKQEILSAQKSGETDCNIERARLANAFPPDESSNQSYNVSWFIAYLHKHCPGWKISEPRSECKVRISYQE